MSTQEQAEKQASTPAKSSAQLMQLMKSELRAFDDPLYFAEVFLHVNLFPMQREIISTFYQRNSDGTRKYNELILTTGMRGSKSFIASVIFAYEAFRFIQLKKPWMYYKLAPGQEVFAINCATSESQALDTIFAAVSARIETSQWFQSRGYDKQYNEFHFSDVKLKIRSEHSNSASLAGKTCKIIALDETARFKDNTGKASGEMVYNTLSRSVKTFGKEGLILSVSSPIFHNDFQMQLTKQCGTIYMIENSVYSDMVSLDLQRLGTSHYYHNPNGLPMSLCYWLTTWEMNPTITRLDLEAEFRRNPEAAMRDFHAVPSAAIEKYYREGERIRSMVDASMADPMTKTGLNPNFKGQNYKYVLAMDPAFKADAMGICLAHIANGKYVVDLATGLKPTKEQGEIQSEDVAKVVSQILDNFRVVKAVSDTYQYPTLIQYIQSRGVEFEQHFVKKPEHDKLKEAIYQGYVATYANEILFKELRELELIKGDKVDHPKYGSKDIADAVANAISLLELKVITRRPAFSFFNLVRKKKP